MRISGLVRMVLAVGGSFALFGQVASANLLTNGDFSAGNTGFTTAYSFASANDCWPEGSYDIVTNPYNCHSLWYSFGDHTTGTGNMMVVNGAPSSGVAVWSETVNVQANSQYVFSGWVTSVYPASAAQLEFDVNGSPVGSVFTPSLTPGQWQQFTVTWNSGSNASATLSIIDQNIIRGGNDFALDDLSFVDPVPEPGSVVLLSLALACVLIPGRRGSAGLLR